MFALKLAQILEAELGAGSPIAAKAKEQAGEGLSKEAPQDKIKQQQRAQEELRDKEQLDKMNKEILKGQQKVASGAATQNEIQSVMDKTKLRDSFQKQMQIKAQKLAQ